MGLGEGRWSQGDLEGPIGSPMRAIDSCVVQRIKEMAVEPLVSFQNHPV